MSAKNRRRRPKREGLPSARAAERAFEKNKRMIEAGETFAGQKSSDWTRKTRRRD